MKPYILNYSEYLPKAASDELSGKFLLDSTRMTATVEPSDRDELRMSTIITRSIEPGDKDRSEFESTRLTETVEPSDRDQIDLEPAAFGARGEERFIHPLARSDRQAI